MSGIVLLHPQRQEIVSLADSLQCCGYTLVFTNGCFDGGLHSGHIRVLQEASRQGDKLIVGLNSDASVRALKGEGRPLRNERERAIEIAAIAGVDVVVVFDELMPLRLIEAIGPDVLVKGADCRERDDQREIVQLVEYYDGRVHYVEVVPGVSTTQLAAAAQQKSPSDCSEGQGLTS